MNSLKNGEGVPPLHFEDGPGVPVIKFKGGTGVPLLNFKGVPGPTFKLTGFQAPKVPDPRVPRSRGPESRGPGPTFTPCRSGCLKKVIHQIDRN